MASRLRFARAIVSSGRVLLFAVAASTIGSVASAEPTAADKETARALMTTGRQDRVKGDLQGALKAFTAADVIMRVPTTSLEVARSQAALGLLVEARDTALQVVRSPVAPHEPAPFRAARDAATALSEDLSTRIPSLTITVTNVPEGGTLALTLDAQPLSAETLGTPRKLDPGHHVISAKAGASEGKQEVDVAEQDAKTVAIELAAAEPVAASEPTRSDPSDTSENDVKPHEGRSATSTALLIGGFGLAGVGVVVGSITGALSLSKTSAIKSSPECSGNVCNPSEDGDLGSAKTMATVSTVSFVVAGVGAVVGIVGLFTGGSPAPAATEHAAGHSEQKSGFRVVRLQPSIGLGSVGLRGEF